MFITNFRILIATDKFVYDIPYYAIKSHSIKVIFHFF